MTGHDLLRELTSAYNRHDLPAISASYTPTATVHWPDAAEPGTVEMLLASYALAFEIMPDARVTVRHITGDDRTAIAELTISGTNTGPVALGDLDRAVLDTDTAVLPPTGRALAIPAAIAVEADGGRITTERQYWSPRSLLLQLGLLEPRPATQPVPSPAPPPE